MILMILKARYFKTKNLKLRLFCRLFSSSPPPPFDFFWNPLDESLFKMIFDVINCNKTCQREQVNKFLQHF